MFLAMLKIAVFLLKYPGNSEGLEVSYSTITAVLPREAGIFLGKLNIFVHNPKAY